MNKISEANGFRRFLLVFFMGAMTLCSFQCEPDIRPVDPPEEVPADKPEEVVLPPRIILDSKSLVIYPSNTDKAACITFSIDNYTEKVRTDILNPGDNLDFTVTPEHGDGHFEIYVCPKEGFYGESDIVITVSNGDLSDSAVIHTETAFVEPMNSSLCVMKTAGEYEMPVKSNVAFTAESSADWIAVTCNASAVFITVEENAALQERRASVIISDKDRLIESEFTVIQYVDGEKKDREALIAIYNALGGDQWNDNRGWCTDVPLNEWTGVSTRNIDGEQRVQYLHIRCQNAVGMIPKAIGDLEYVSELWIIQEPGVTGTIPGTIGNLTRATDIRIAMTSVYGGIPSAFKHMNSLRKLSLYDNELTGSLPLWLADMDQLESFGFEGNRLDGEVDESLTLTPWWTVMTQDTQEPMGDAKMRIGQKYPYRLWKHGHENDDPTYYNQDDPANPLGPEDFIFD